jgi:4-amino-4-deoxy-L-arabinose transferase-like glycosyltransferase
MSLIQQQFKRGTWCFDSVLLLFGIALLFGLFLGSRPLSTPDEARYAEIPREMLVLHDFVTPHLNGIKYFEKPPLFYWLQAASIKLFYPEVGKVVLPENTIKLDNTLPLTSIDEWVVRIPNALLALLGCLFLYAAGRVLFDRMTGLLSAAILATSFLYFTLARMVTLDMCLSVFLSGSLLAFLIAVNWPSSAKRRYLLYLAYVFSALAVLTKGIVGILFPAMIVGLWILCTAEWRLLKQIYLPSGILLFLIIVLPWHILVQLKNPEFFQFYFIDQQFLRYSTLIAQRYQPDWFFIPILFTGFLPWVVFLVQTLVYSFPKTQLQIKEKRIQLFLLIWIASIFVFFSLSHSKLIPYILPVFPAVALLTGNYLYHCKNSPGAKWGIIALPWIWLILGSVLLLFLKIEPTMVPKAGIPFLIGGFSLFQLTAFFATFCYVWNKKKTAFILLVLGSALSFIIFITGIPKVDTRSVKPLVQRLKPLLQAHDKIISYKDYYQDLPFYLNRRVMAVDVTGELIFGMQHQNTKSWMLSDADFWPLWESPQRVFLIADKVQYRNLQKKTKSIYLLDSTAEDVLVSNHAIEKINHPVPKDKQ